MLSIWLFIWVWGLVWQVGEVWKFGLIVGMGVGEWVWGVFFWVIDFRIEYSSLSGGID